MVAEVAVALADLVSGRGLQGDQVVVEAVEQAVLLVGQEMRAAFLQ